MSGTIVISPDESLDVRTIDFLAIVDALRAHTEQAGLVRKALESVDEFGMNMICVDEFDAHDFRLVATLMRSVASELGATDPGLAAFLDTVCARMAADSRSGG